MDELAPPTDEHRFPCTTCGSDLEFDPDTDGMLCPHCGATQDIPDIRGQRISELDFEKALGNQLASSQMQETRVSTCPNCAAHIEISPDIQATECPFCATPVVTDTGSERQIKPQAVLPFDLTQDQARDAMNAWLGKLWFAPGGLQQYARKGRKLDGIYVPYWTFDADTRTIYEGARGTNYKEQVPSSKPGQPSTTRIRTRWSAVRGKLKRAFDDVIILASKSLPKRYTDALAPWEMGALKPYRPEFLSGFLAEGYTVSLEDGFGEAKARMDAMIEQDIRQDIGGDKQRITSVNTYVNKVTFKHVLLPVWMAAYKYRGKTYRFVVNGQSGRVKGERPYSVFKIAIAILIALLIALTIGYFMTVQQ